jgi:ankyrin repeat protein
MPSRKALRTALSKLPTGSAAYDSAYEDAMKRIEGQIPEKEKLAKQVLSWITCARRPLTMLELQHALAVEADETELDKENFSEIDDMVSACAGLVTIDQESGIIRLVHFTTQEYFERTHKNWFPQAESDITKICIAYLSFSVFDSGFCRTNADFEKRLRLNLFYDYSARNWGHHAREASPTLCRTITGFLESKEKMEASVQALMVPSPSAARSYSQIFPVGVRGLHLAAFFGLKGVVEELLARDLPESDPKDSFGWTPLMYASVNGHDAVVVQLLAAATIDADSKSSPTVSFPIVSGSTVNSPFDDCCEQDPSYNPDRQYFLEDLEDMENLFRPPRFTGKCYTDAGTASSHYSGRSALSFASENGHKGIVKRLLATNVIDPDSVATGRIQSGRTPLSFAAQNGHDAIVKRLLITGNVDPDSRATGKGHSGRTPLSFAAERGHATILERLLATGKVDTNSIDHRGMTPLAFAVENGHTTIV